MTKSPPSQAEKKKEKVRYFSMFTGIGGFELGITQAYEHNQNLLAQGKPETDGRHPDTLRSEGDKPLSLSLNGDGRGVRPICVGFSEIDKYASQLLQIKWPTVKNYGDATKIDEHKLPDFDLLVGGFPCQSFSIAGKRKGFDDTRGTLFFDIARILAYKKPQYLLLENVKGLLSHDGGETFQTIIGVLTDLGYFVEWQVLNSKNFGVPQNRERVFIVGHLGGVPGRKVFPINEIRVGCKNPAVTLTQRGYGSQRNGTYVATDTETKIRRLTPLECERLQGFPDNWTKGFSDTQRYKMCGNAVTVNVVQYVISKMLL